MTVSSMRGTRPAAVGPATQIPIVHGAQAFAHRLATRRALPNTDQRDLPTPATRREQARPVQRSTARRANSGKTSATISRPVAGALQQRSHDRGEVQTLSSLVHMAAVRKAVRELAQQVLWRKRLPRKRVAAKKRCLTMTVSIDGIGEISVSLRESAGGWQVDVQAKDLVGTLALRDYAYLLQKN